MQTKTGLRAGLLAGVFLLYGAAAPAASLYNVELNTTPWVSSSAEPYVLNIQLVDGSEGGEGNANNTVRLTNFQFGTGGSPVLNQVADPALVPNTTGGVSGDFASGITLIDSEFLNLFTGLFVPGNELSFQMELTDNTESMQPDQLSIYLLNRDGVGVDGAVLSMSLGPQMIDQREGFVVTPAATEPVPEPASLLLLGTGLLSMGLYRRRKQ